MRFLQRNSDLLIEQALTDLFFLMVTCHVLCERLSKYLCMEMMYLSVRCFGILCFRQSSVREVANCGVYLMCVCVCGVCVVCVRACVHVCVWLQLQLLNQLTYCLEM